MRQPPQYKRYMYTSLTGAVSDPTRREQHTPYIRKIRSATLSKYNPEPPDKAIDATYLYNDISEIEEATKRNSGAIFVFEQSDTVPVGYRCVYVREMYNRVFREVNIPCLVIPAEYDGMKSGLWWILDRHSNRLPFPLDLKDRALKPPLRSNTGVSINNFDANKAADDYMHELMLEQSRQQLTAWFNSRIYPGASLTGYIPPNVAGNIYKAG